MRKLLTHFYGLKRLNPPFDKDKENCLMDSTAAFLVVGA